MSGALLGALAVARAGEGRDQLADGVLEVVEAAGHRVTVVREGGPLPRLVTADGRELAVGDRVALSPDGAQVAFVAPREGLAAVWVVPYAGGEPHPVTPPVARPAGGGAPLGFVAPPRDRSLAFRGDSLCWTRPDAAGETCVGWR